MDSDFLKAFLPEIFFSVVIFSQLLFNTTFVNKLIFNYPIITKEVISQIFFTFICLIFLYNNQCITGYFQNFLFVCDTGSICLKIVFITVSSAVFLLIVRGSFLQEINFFEYFLLFLLSIFSLLLLINASDILSIYLIIEMQALCFYILASFKRNSSFSTEAGLKYFVAGSFISCIFLLGASLIYGSLGTLQLNSLSLLLSFDFSNDFDSIHLLVIFGVILITVTLLFKISAAPFHFWAPDVYEGSPLASTIIFSIIPKLSIFVFFIRWIFATSLIFLDINFIFLQIAVLSVFFGTFFAIKQKRVKRLIIYSSIAQVGFLIAPFFTLSIDGFAFIFFYLFIYLLTSTLVWGNLILFYDSFNVFKTFSQNCLASFFISNLAGLSKVNKLSALSFVFIFFSISGIPPLAGFLAKIFIFLNLLEFKQFLGSVLLMIFNIISVYYYIRIIKVVFFEVKMLSINNLEFQMTFNLYLQGIIIFLLVSLLFALIFVFFYPTLFYLFSQYCILGLENF